MTSFIDNNLVFSNPIATEDFMYIHNAIEPIIKCTTRSMYSNLRQLINLNIFTHVGAGCNGLVVRYKDYAIKLYHTDNNKGRDGEMLSKVQGTAYFPRLFYYYKNTYMVTEFIDGLTLGEAMDTLEIPFVDSFVQLLKFCDERKVEASDIGISDNIRIRDNITPVIVDVGCFDSHQTPDNLFCHQGMVNSIRDRISQRQKTFHFDMF
jgi:hypothetical protein